MKIVDSLRHLWVICIFVLIRCTNSVPDCSSDETKSLVKNTFSDKIKIILFPDKQTEGQILKHNKEAFLIKLFFLEGGYVFNLDNLGEARKDSILNEIDNFCNRHILFEYLRPVKIDEKIQKSECECNIIITEPVDTSIIQKYLIKNNNSSYSAVNNIMSHLIDQYFEKNTYDIVFNIQNIKDEKNDVLLEMNKEEEIAEVLGYLFIKYLFFQMYKSIESGQLSDDKAVKIFNLSLTTQQNLFIPYLFDEKAREAIDNVLKEFYR